MPQQASKAVSYLRVSTERQGKSGLGLEAQREAVTRYLASVGATLVQEFEEVETGKGSDALDKRPKLKAAVALAKKQKAVLVIAKLDRLARNVHFISGLMETGVEFRCCDFPTADRTMIHIYAAMAEHEGRRISERIRDALAAKKARGEAVGNPKALQPFNGARAAAAAEFASRVQPTIAAFVAQGLKQRAIVAELNAVGIKTANGGAWGLIQLQRVLARVPAA
ncbi:MAG: recombinase family protein [Rubrivivax sp.]|nr:recombinase family protein [Rubrivivax sp.]MDP3615559.1 recombinase family protein [Rubrivivax sp.]